MKRTERKYVSFTAFVLIVLLLFLFLLFLYFTSLMMTTCSFRTDICLTCTTNFERLSFYYANRTRIVVFLIDVSYIVCLASVNLRLFFFFFCLAYSSGNFRDILTKFGVFLPRSSSTGNELDRSIFTS